MQTKHWLGAIFVVLVALIGIVAIVIAATGRPRFNMDSVFAFVSDSSTPISVQLEVYSGDANGPLVYSTTQTIAVGGEWEVNVRAIPAIPDGFQGIVQAYSDGQFHGEFRLKGFTLPFSVHNWSTSPGTFDIRYLRAGAVVQAYPGIAIASDQTIRITAGQYAPPASYDAVLIASTVAVEGYYSSAAMEIRKK